ncbi:MAG: TAXI family TRAP transporter solute-binding subunit [Oscillospiraceae bacterium]|nr:TAXI family TRAP transporter solute-binding subunit [Oscillospiraceae bacterium]
MKKKLAIVFVLLLCVLVVLGACGEGGGGSTRLIMATGGVAGTYYPLGGAMAAVINQHTDVQVTVNASGASFDNIRQLEAGDAHIALAQNDVMYYAFTGTGPWGAQDNDPVTTLATLMTLYPETVHVVVAADSGIYSVEDLAGRRVSIGDVGSGVEANAIHVLGIHGLSVDDISVLNLGFSASADAMRDRQLDAFFVTSAAPNTAVMDLSVSRDLRILSLAEDKIQALLDAHQFYGKVTLTSSDYSFLTEPVNTVAVQATLVTSTALDEQVAFDIVRALIENASEVEEGHARGADIRAESAVQSISVDFHPGALRFFQEIGAIG